ncbi:MAG: hypothetical protein M1832_005026 [Thelocarpon impressellum]|nr:MAG: hypothetical protein M1832_005026 [Thelocarpon impressellum]
MRAIRSIAEVMSQPRSVEGLREAVDSSFTSGLNGVDVAMDNIFTTVLCASFGGVCVLLLLARLVQMANCHMRHLFSLTADREQQRFWMKDRTALWPALKKHLLYAPLWKKRHNREMRLSSAINMGTLPSRLHALLLLLYVASNVAYTLSLDYRGQSKASLLAEIRGRAGVLAVVNMIPLFILAGRNNPLIGMLRVSFDTYNLLHRWMGRIVVLEAIVHTLAWLANQVLSGGWRSVNETMARSRSFQFGAAGVISMALLLLQSPSAVRHAFYETFLHLHQAAALAAVVGVYFHLKLDKLPQLPYIKALIALWALERTARFLRVYYRCHSWRKGWTTVQVQALPGEACRVTFEMRRPWAFRPGCHVYAYIPAISMHQSHPFSVAWSEDTAASPALPGDNDREKLLPTTQNELDRPRGTTTSISLVIHKRTGMTASLYNTAAAAPSGRLTLRGAVEGPYGGLESLHSYGTVVLFAGGIGITHQVSHVRDLVMGHSAGTVAARKVVLIWTVRTTEHLEWVRPWMDTILALPGRRAVLKILLFVTKPRSPREIISPSTSVQMYPGRPQADVLIDREIQERAGAMAVTVCGPGSLADSVRAAVRRRVDVASLDFVEESFTW